MLSKGNFQVNNIFKTITQTLQPQQSMGQPERLENLINRSSGLGRVEKDIIFNYIKNGEDKSRQKKDYITNIVIIFNSFFEYGFLKKSSFSSSTGGGRSSYTDEWADGDDSNQLGRIEHYWEYISMQFIQLDSVKYINFYYEDASTNIEKALGWILLALNSKDEIKNVLMEIFGSIPILQLYSKEDSYLWTNRREILEAVDIVSQRDMYNPCPLLDNFIDFGRKQEEKKHKNQFLETLENPSHIEGDANHDDDTPSLPFDVTNNHVTNSSHRKSQMSDYQEDLRHPSEKLFTSRSDHGNHYEEDREDIIDDRFMKNSHANSNIKPENIIKEQLVINSASSQSMIEKVSNHYQSIRQSRGSMQQSYDSKDLFMFQQQQQYEMRKKNSISSQQEFQAQKKVNYRAESTSQADKVSNSSKQDSQRNVYDNPGQDRISQMQNQRLNLFSGQGIHTPQSKDIKPYVLKTPNAYQDSTDNQFWFQDQLKGNNTLLTNRYYVHESDTFRPPTQRTDNSQLATSPFKLHKQQFDSDRQDTYQNQEDDHQQSMGMEESRRVLDKIFTENDVLVPMNQRKKYKMVYQDKFGKQYIKEMLNSDLIYLNEFYDKLKIKEYNFAKKQMFMKRKDLNRQHSRTPNNVCWNCYQKFEKTFGLFDNKNYCYFCLDYVCHQCTATEKVLIPLEFQLQGTIGRQTVCREAFEFIQNFSYLKIDKRNPLLQFNPQLRNLLVQRRKLHKIFDLIKCNKWNKILEIHGFTQHKNLILKDCYLTFEQVYNLKRLEKEISNIFEVIKEHIENCPSCYYKGEKCQICLSNRIIQIHDVQNAVQCQQCRKKGHRECIKDHNC